MATSISVTEITKAIIAVMKAVKGIEKGMTVGSGTNSYKGVSDKDVKKEIGKAMEANGLALVPVDVDPIHQIDRWVEESNYGPKQKQSVFTSVKTKYMLMHESGEWIELSGYGHGVDTQDKAAGKATTYALKNTLLYTFLVPTGEIDDADKNHSDEAPIPPVRETSQRTNGQAAKKADQDKPLLEEGSTAFSKALFAMKDGSVSIAQIEKKYKLTDDVRGILEAAGAVHTLKN